MSHDSVLGKFSNWYENCILSYSISQNTNVINNYSRDNFDFDNILSY